MAIDIHHNGSDSLHWLGVPGNSLAIEDTGESSSGFLKYRYTFAGSRTTLASAPNRAQFSQPCCSPLLSPFSSDEACQRDTIPSFDSRFELSCH